MMTKKINTRKQVLYWFLVRMTQGLMFASVILIVIIIIGDCKIKIIEQPTIICWDTTQESVQEEFKRYIESLPIPNMDDVPRAQNIGKKLKEVCQEVCINATAKVEEYDEEYLLAKGIHGEASICDREEKYKVGTVIMNRVAHSRYPDTVEGVLAADGQYSCYQDNRWFTEEPSQEELEIARDIYVNGTRVFGPEVIYQSKLCAGECIEITPWHEYGTD